MAAVPCLPHLAPASRAERAALARERFFEEGQLPSGLVDDVVLQSWQRCRAERRDPREAVQVDPVTRLRLDAALRRSRTLREAVQGELQHLQRALANTGCTILLLDAQGLVLHAFTPPSVARDRLIRSIARPGVDLSEQALGTNAPGLVLRYGKTCSVDIGEHYFDQIAALRCAAAPIRDIDGRIAAVLDITVEHGFGFEPAALVGLHAAAMQRACRLAQSTDLFMVELHVHPQALGTLAAGLMGVQDDGSVAWLDAAAETFTGVRPRLAGERVVCEEALGLDRAGLLEAAARGHPRPLPLPNGLGVWARVRAPCGPSPAYTHVAPALPQATAVMPAASASLDEHHRALILHTLQQCAGNLSATARRLGISRGRVYRAVQAEPG